MTPDELFPASEVALDSPRLLWLRRHGILTWFDDGKRDGYTIEPEWFAGFQHWWPGQLGINFFATETAHNGDSRIGQGDDEDEALIHLLTCAEARQRGIKHWSEETP